MRLGRLNHVGVATPSIEKSVALYRDLLGALCRVGLNEEQAYLITAALFPAASGGAGDTGRKRPGASLPPGRSGPVSLGAFARYSSPPLS